MTTIFIDRLKIKSILIDKAIIVFIFTASTGTSAEKNIFLG